MNIKFIFHHTRLKKTHKNNSNLTNILLDNWSLEMDLGKLQHKTHKNTIDGRETLDLQNHINPRQNLRRKGKKTTF